MMKRPLTLFVLLLSLLTLSTPTKAQTYTDTIRFTVKPSTEAGATNTLTYNFSHKVKDGIRVEWVSEGNRENLTLEEDWQGNFTTTRSITSAGQVCIYYTYHNVADGIYAMKFSKILVGLPSMPGSGGGMDFLTNGAVIDSLDVSGCGALGGLNINDNGRIKLTALNARGCSTLRYLDCRSNQLTALDVSGCIGLANLDCSGNQLTTLDVSTNPALTSLSCNNNSLTALDVSANPALKTLYCDGNHLTALDVSANIVLDILSCANNKLTEWNVNNSNVRELRCNGNQLTALNVSACVELVNFSCNDNQLPDLDLSHNSLLRILDCNNNQLTTLDISANTALMDLYCGSNPLTSLDCGENNNLRYLYAESCTSLENVYGVSNKQLETLIVSGCTALDSLDCSYNQLNRLNVNGCTNLAYLNCAHNQLEEYGFNKSGCTALQYLNCSENQLADLDVSDNKALKSLRCWNNQLTDLDVSECTSLEVLWCYNNQLTTLDVSSCTALNDLDCSHNQLMVLDVSECTDLESLGCDSNHLTDLDISQNSFLTGLDCSENHISLSTVHGIFKQRGVWHYFSAYYQTDTVALLSCEAWDLSSEKEFGGTVTTFGLADEAGGEVSAGAYRENDFIFLFKEPFNGILDLQNDSVPNASFVWHISAEECLEETFTVQVSANDAEWGSVSQSGDGTYKKDSLASITATPQEGYRFVKWTRTDGSEFSIYAVYTFAVTEDLVLVANFEEVPVVPVVDSFRVVAVSNNGAWGRVSQSGNGRYEKDSSVRITASPAEGYRFVNWMRAGLPEAFGTAADGVFGTAADRVFGTGADTTFKVIENLILIANFEKIPDEPVPPVEEGFTVDLSANNPAWGMVFKTGNCTYGEGEEITILALPFAGYRFVNWTGPDGSVFGTDSLITFKVTENLELTANFGKIPDGPVPPVVDTFTVVVVSNNEAWGSVSQNGNGRYEKDSSVLITATPAEGYRFVNWTKDGNVFATQADTAFKVTEDIELVAVFEKIPEEKPTEDDFHIYVKDNVIYLSENRGKVQVFNVIGQCLYTGNTTAIRVRQTGVYIICVAGQNYKVLVM